MAVTTAALAVLMFVAPAPNTSDPQTAGAVLMFVATNTSDQQFPYSAESVVLGQDRNENQMTNDQVISAIYDDDDEGK